MGVEDSEAKNLARMWHNMSQIGRIKWLMFNRGIMKDLFIAVKRYPTKEDCE